MARPLLAVLSVSTIMVAKVAWAAQQHHIDATQLDACGDVDGQKSAAHLSEEHDHGEEDEDQAFIQKPRSQQRWSLLQFLAIPGNATKDAQQPAQAVSFRQEIPPGRQAKMPQGKRAQAAAAGTACPPVAGPTTPPHAQRKVRRNRLLLKLRSFDFSPPPKPKVDTHKLEMVVQKSRARTTIDKNLTVNRTGYVPRAETSFDWGSELVMGLLVLIVVLGWAQSCHRELELEQKEAATAATLACEPEEPFTPKVLEDTTQKPECKFPGLSPRLDDGATPKLSHVGTRYVLPWSQVTESEARSLSVEVSTTPAAWPLRAALKRAEDEDVWAEIQLTRNVISAVKRPPLLVCTRCDCAPSTPKTEAVITGGLEEFSPANPPSADAGLTKLAEVRNGSGALLAAVVRERGGRPRVQKPDQCYFWEVDSRLAREDYWIAMHRCGEHVALASQLLQHKASGGGAQVQIETQPENSSESMLLFMCMLAMLAFQI